MFTFGVTWKYGSSLAPTSAVINWSISCQKLNNNYHYIDYRLGCSCLRGHDFIEGVRAAIVDKDRNPTWNPKTLAEVTPDIISSFFAQTPGVEDLNLHEDLHHDKLDRLNQIH